MAHETPASSAEQHDACAVATELLLLVAGPPAAAAVPRSLRYTNVSKAVKAKVAAAIDHVPTTSKPDDETESDADSDADSDAGTIASAAKQVRRDKSTQGVKKA